VSTERPQDPPARESTDPPAEEAGAPSPTPPARPDTDGHTCDICGAPMLERHCKIACPVCGYLRDCSDP